MKTYNFPLHSKTLKSFIYDYESLKISEKEEILDKIKKLNHRKNFIFVELNEDIHKELLVKLKENGFHEIYSFGKSAFLQKSISITNIKHIDEIFSLNISDYELLIESNTKPDLMSPFILFHLIEKDKLTGENTHNLLKATSYSLLYAMSHSGLMNDINNIIIKGLVNYKKNNYDEVSLFRSLFSDEFFNKRPGVMMDLLDKIITCKELDYRHLLKSITPILYKSSEKNEFIQYFFEKNLEDCLDWMYEDEDNKNILHFEWSGENLTKIIDHIIKDKLFYLIEKKDNDDMTPIELLEFKSLLHLSESKKLAITKIKELEDLKKIDDEKNIIEKVILNDDINVKINKKRI